MASKRSKAADDNPRAAPEPIRLVASNGATRRGEEGASLTRLVVRISQADARAISAESKDRGMSRGEWIRACVRRQISSVRQLARPDKASLRASAAELRRIRSEVGRMRAELVRSLASGGDAGALQGALAGLDRKLSVIAAAIRQGQRGNDEYWRRLEGGAEGASAANRARS